LPWRCCSAASHKYTRKLTGLRSDEVAHENVNEIFIQRQHRYTDDQYSIGKIQGSRRE
jgi:hypothetical protein